MDGQIVEVRPHTGIPELYVVSPAFVNAHSHLEYRGLQGAIEEREFWPWIREITRLKPEQDLGQVRSDTHLAALENRRTGVALIGEHSDRPYSGEAMAKAGLQGVIFQEVITLLEREAPEEKLASVAEKAEHQRKAFAGDVQLNPHAIYTVDPGTLRKFGESKSPISLHLAETPDESAFTKSGEGPIAEFYRNTGVPFEPTGLSAFGAAKLYGLVRPGAQLVHCCDLSDAEIEELSGSGATVAHCPGSNAALGCPPAKVREMLDARIDVGLGLDSPASSGPIDMFEEMRCALKASLRRNAPVLAEEVWRMATSMGARSLGFQGWDIRRDSSVPLIKIHIPDALETEDLIERCSPGMVEWL